jgi:predicted DNA-binding protein (UPF0251 family)
MAKAKPADVKRAHDAAKAITNLASYESRDGRVQQEWQQATDDLVDAFRQPGVHDAFNAAALQCGWGEVVRAHDAICDCDFMSGNAHHLAMQLGLARSLLAADDSTLLWIKLDHEFRVARDLITALPKGTAKQRAQRRNKADVARALTPKQTEAIHVVGECKGNIAKAAKQLGRSRKTVKQNYEAGMRKIAATGVKPKTIPIALDRRGQANISPEDDRRR